MKRILITGSSGYVGSHLLSRVANYYPNVEICVCDTKQGQSYEYLEDHNFDFVFHLGAMSIIGGSAGLADKMMDANALDLIDFFQNNRVGKFIFSSTGALYGERNTPATEDDAHWSCCLNPYSQSKYIAEGIIRRMCPNHIIARFGNVFGGVIPKRDEILALTHFKNDNPIVVFGGDQTRDFVHVDTICEALIQAAQSSLTGTFNLANGVSVRLGDIAEEFGQKRGVPVIYKPARQEDVMHTVLDSTKARDARFLPQEIQVNDYNS